MGSCSSVHNKSETDMKLKLSFGCKSEKFVIRSPVKNNERTTIDAAFKSHSVPSFRDSGSKEEKFFDSQPWLESDCDDDFLSVNGDFTPSRGNTPVHQSISKGNSWVSKPRFEDRAPKAELVTSPTDKKKKLVELFRDSSRGYEDGERIASGDINKDNENIKGGETTSGGPCSNSRDGTSSAGATHVSHSGKAVPNGNGRPPKRRSVKSVQCCLPSLSSTCSYSESKKKTSPVHNRL